MNKKNIIFINWPVHHIRVWLSSQKMFIKPLTPVLKWLRKRGKQRPIKNMTTLTKPCCIFNESLATSVVPTPFKKSVIIPVPKNSKPSCLNDYRPVALTSTVIKVFERLLKKHICSSIPATLDPLQFAYRPNRSTDDAISQVLHSSLTHIDSKNGNYVRLLFIDYSSAFNTIV